MAKSTKIQVPYNVSDPLVLRRFLSTLIEQLDVVFGYRGQVSFATDKELANSAEALLETLAETSSALAQTIEAAAAAAEQRANAYTDEAEQRAKDYADANFTNNPEQPAIAVLGHSAVSRSASYVQAEAQQVANNLKAVADKVDEILAALQAAEILQ